MSLAHRPMLLHVLLRASLVSVQAEVRAESRAAKAALKAARKAAAEVRTARAKVPADDPDTKGSCETTRGGDEDEGALPCPKKGSPGGCPASKKRRRLERTMPTLGARGTTSSDSVSSVITAAATLSCEVVAASANRATNSATVTYRTRSRVRVKA